MFWQALLQNTNSFLTGTIEDLLLLLYGFFVIFRIEFHKRRLFLELLIIC